MNIRSTAQTQSNSAIAYLRQRTTELAKYQDQISSGVRIRQASDDPGAFVTLSAAKATSTRYAAYGQSASDATATLNGSVSALQDVNDALVRAKQIASEGINATTDAIGHSALANEVDGLIDRVVRAANTQSDGKYLFGGTATDTPPFAATSVDAQGRPAAIAYSGANENSRTLIGPNQTADTRYDGSQVFQKTGSDVFDALIQLRNNLRSPVQDKSTLLSNSLASLDAARDQVGNVVGQQAASLTTIEAVQNRLSDLKFDADTRSGQIEGTDFAEAIVRLNENKSTLEATMAVTAKLLEPSLLDFIR